MSGDPRPLYRFWLLARLYLANKEEEKVCKAHKGKRRGTGKGSSSLLVVFDITYMPAFLPLVQFIGVQVVYDETLPVVSWYDTW